MEGWREGERGCNIRSMDKGGNYGCVTRKFIRQCCAPEEVEPGKHVYRCEKTIQTLRDCIGRPTEVIESETEITEHEMGEGWNHEMHISRDLSSQSFSSINRDREFMEEIDNAIKEVERMTGGIMAGVERFTKEAERITGSLFGFPSFPGDEREERSPLFRFPPFPEDEREERSRHGFSFPIKEEERDAGERDEYERQEQESLYSEFADKVRDV